ncbi:MAG: formate dehydrogenase accessory sulfurtransferase FdhD [Sphingomonadales bacterium]|nr:formate dehydrogenase accessory sulfurtransferase FdhD [Sphingomonadales bacterium]
MCARRRRRITSNRTSPPPGHRAARFLRVAADGAAAPLTREVAGEAPVAIEINGLGYAVLMATPADLGDLVYGFLQSERLAAPAEILSHDIAEVAAGTIIRVTVTAAAAARLDERVRHRTSESACGLCGIENLEQALRALPVLPAQPLPRDAAIFAALAALAETQPLNRTTGAVHAAALCTRDGAIRLVREDVGRHNAFDKLLGAMRRGAMGWDGGFALLSSRCSFELVEKAVLAGCPLLATISAPTALALTRAAGAGLALRVLARPDSLLAPL